MRIKSLIYLSALYIGISLAIDTVSRQLVLNYVNEKMSNVSNEQGLGGVILYAGVYLAFFIIFLPLFTIIASRGIYYLSRIRFKLSVLSVKYHIAISFVVLTLVAFLSVVIGNYIKNSYPGFSLDISELGSMFLIGLFVGFSAAVWSFMIALANRIRKALV